MPALFDRQRECERCGRPYEARRRDQRFCSLDCKEAPQRGYVEAWHPQAKTVELLERVDAVLAEYAAHLPLTLRQIFYRLVAAGFPKTVKEYGRLSRTLATARRARRIPFSAIRDDSLVHAEGDGLREADTSPAGYIEEVEDGLRALLWDNGYRRGAHEGQPFHIEVWCESAGMVPQLQSAVARYGADVRSGTGMDSVSAKKMLAELVAGRDVPTVLLHVGDLDEHGGYIFDALAEDVEAFVKVDGGDFRYVRAALTREQAEREQLETFEGAIQAEALPPDVLGRLVEQAVLDHYDLDIAAGVRRREQAEREEVDRMLAELRERIDSPEEGSGS